MSDFKQLISDYFDGDLSEERAEELRQFIQQDLGNAREFMRAALLHNCLHEFLNVSDEKEDSGNLGDAHILPAIHDAEPPAAASVAPRPLEHVLYLPRRAPQEPPAKRRSSAFSRRTWLVAAGLLIPLFALALWYAPPQPRIDRSAPKPIAATAPVAPPVSPLPAPPITVATLSRVIDAQWQTTAIPLETNRRLTLDTYSLLSGYAQLKFDSGASIVLRGPAKFTLDSPLRMRLLFGSLTTDVPPSAKGFTVEIPAASVVDLGTEIGVAVDPAHDSHVEVFKGLAEVQLASAPENRLLTPATAILVNTARSKLEETAPEPIAFTRDSQLDDVARAAVAAARWSACSEKLRQDRDLVAYYSFAGPFEAPGKLKNLAVATTGQFDGQLEKVTWETGRFPDRPAMHFKEDASRALVNIAQPFTSLTMTAWVNLHNFDQNYVSILMCDGAHDRSDLCHLQFARLGGFPSLQFSTPGPNLGWNHYHFHAADLPTDLDRWRFVAVVYDPSTNTVSGYIDGVCIETLPIAHKPPPLVIGSAQIGNWNASRPDDNRLFNGLIDDLAIWKRPLKPEEILAIYQAGYRPPP